MPLILRVEVPTSSCGGIALCLGIPPWQDRFSYVCDYKGTVRERLGFCRRDRHVVKSVCRVRSPPPAPREQLFWVFKYAVAFFFYIVTSSLFWKFPRTLKIRVYSLCVCVCTSRRWRGGEIPECSIGLLRAAATVSRSPWICVRVQFSSCCNFGLAIFAIASSRRLRWCGARVLCMFYLFFFRTHLTNNYAAPSL